MVETQGAEVKEKMISASELAEEGSPRVPFTGFDPVEKQQGEAQRAKSGLGTPGTEPLPPRPPPVATTVEEDLEEEIREENLFALETAVETLTTEITELITDPRRSVKHVLAKDLKKDEDRRRIEYRLDVLQRRQAKGMRKFELVEDMFEKALERRLRSHTKLAADPPAERLVGESMMLHVPSAWVPQERQAVSRGILSTQPQLEDETSRLVDPARWFSGGGRVALPSKSAITTFSTTGESSRREPLVFLTETEEKAIQGNEGASEGAGEGELRSASPPPHHKEIEEALLDFDLLTPKSKRARRQAALDALYEVPEDRRRAWRELGYNVHYVGHRVGVTGRLSSHQTPKDTSSTYTAVKPLRRAEKLVSNPTSSGDTPPPPPATSSQKPGRSSYVSNHKAASSSDSFLHLAPLPAVCLVQRRLQAEDMKLEHLLEEQRQYLRFKATVPIPRRGEARRASRWEPLKKSMEEAPPAQLDTTEKVINPA